ncbi:chymotrypsin-2-like [Nasonia vitripennis]|uniref:Peptidase S1 domain-containing protein n=1 Tax=Nasonia vitripennis TaxID=7425 RepID=A0A7M7QRT8_NASVI|nr:chymotrypsin-2-like [Nasonia vitripennis]
MFTVLRYKWLKLDSRDFSTTEMIFLLCCIGSIALVNGQGKSLSRRIIDGNVAQPSQFPYVARLFYKKIPECSATIIHERWALTAGHCIKHNRSDPTILVGSVNYQSDKNGAYYNAERLIQHEQYVYIPGRQNNGKEYVVNDIGLVRLNRPVAFTANVQKIRVPNYVENYANAIGKIVGFGLRTAGVLNNQLHYGTVRLITNEECRAFYPYVMDKHLCAAIVGRNSPCSGDSGGPLIVKGNEIGITSTIADENICNPNAGPSLFTKVDRFKPWIQQHLAAYGEWLP